MALAALAPLLGSLAGGSLASSGALGALGMGGLFSGAGGTLLGSAIGSGLGTTAATGDLGKGLESGLLGYGLGGAMGAFNPSGGAAMTPAAINGDASLQGVGPMADMAGSGASVAPSALSNGTIQLQPGQIFGGMSNGTPVIVQQAAQVPSALSKSLAGLIPGAEVATPGIALTGEALQPAPPVDPTYTSPGLTPYKPRTAAAIQANYLPGTGPEIDYFNPSTGYAAGGPVMTATALNLTPQQIMQQQLLRQQQAPNGYAGGGSVSSGKNLVDSRGLSFLNHEAMKQAMPMSMGAQGTPGGMNPNMGAKLPKFAAGGMPMAPGMQGIADPSAGDMAVPPIAGDGMSDSIPATIDGKQPALLSSNEHVIPADAVSALGNGSSAAGHKALKGMVKRVRIAKTGKASQPPAINPANYLPA